MLGTCCVYTVFVASNIKAVADYFLGYDVDVRIYVLIILLPLILINWVSALIDESNRCSTHIYTYTLRKHSQIRNLKWLAPFSTVANFFTLISFGIICYYIFREPISLEGKRTVGPLAEFPLFFGTVLFALEVTKQIQTASKKNLRIFLEIKNSFK